MKRDGEWQQQQVAEGGRHGKGVIARLVGCDDREHARLLMGCEIGIYRDQLPETRPGEYYWSDLHGLNVVTLDDDSLGVVDHLIETGANDVLVVKGERERLIPFVMGNIVRRVDLGGGEIQVNWDKEF